MRSIRHVLTCSDVTLGTFLSMGSPLAAEACALAGFDWLLIDLEHGAGDEMTMIGQIRAAGMHQVPCVVRVENAERIRSGRVLDLGAKGVMIPRLDTVDEVSAAVRHLRYPPLGDRGVATYHAAGGFGLHPEWLDTANEETVCIVQIETLTALENVDRIAAVPGVDVVFVGPRDLTSALGVPADFMAPAYLDALQQVVSAAQTNGVHAGILATSAQAAEQHIRDGFSFVAISSDCTTLAVTARQNLVHVRDAIRPTTLSRR